MTTTDPRAWMADLLDDVDPADWFSKDELAGMLEHHGADPDRIDTDATLMHLAPAMAAALTAVLDQADAMDGIATEPVSDDVRSAMQLCARGIRRAITEHLGGDRG